MQNSESETGITCGRKRNITEKAVPFAKLLAQKSTVLLSTTDGRKLYLVCPTPAFKRDFFLFGRSLPRTDRYEIKERADVTGNRYDRGYILIEGAQAQVRFSDGLGGL